MAGKKPKLFSSDAELKTLVAAFESTELPLKSFRHHQHMAVALWYLRHHDLDTAIVKIRKGLQTFLVAKGLNEGYNETLTVFWMRYLAKILQRSESSTAFFEQVNAIVPDQASLEPAFRHYRRETLFSEAAKASWIAPDLKPLDGD